MSADLGDLWVFGYGSLMWRPDFPFAERHRARVDGLHRGLYVFSHVHRGTPERPGLVLGLDEGGSCEGIAFRVRARDRMAVIDYLREREQVTAVYRERTVPVTVSGEDRPVMALTYVVDRTHQQYAGQLAREDALSLVRQGVGQSGPCREYVLNTVLSLERMGLHDPTLHWLAERLSVDQPGRHGEAPPALLS